MELIRITQQVTLYRVAQQMQVQVKVDRVVAPVYPVTSAGETLMSVYRSLREQGIGTGYFVGYLHYPIHEPTKEYDFYHLLFKEGEGDPQPKDLDNIFRVVRGVQEQVTSDMDRAKVTLAIMRITQDTRGINND